MKNTFPWDGNQVVKSVYNTNNYKIIDTNANGNKALICCSSNALYFPNSEETFKEKIIGGGDLNGKILLHLQ